VKPFWPGLRSECAWAGPERILQSAWVDRRAGMLRTRFAPPDRDAEAPRSDENSPTWAVDGMTRRRADDVPEAATLRVRWCQDTGASSRRRVTFSCVSRPLEAIEVEKR